ncbi:hypothetical protein EON66_04155 [archaeon]|nr:MAG: hypothetical protein EON66_04155 [archaeon]
MKVSPEELKAARVDVGYRDYCAHLLVPLNKCRQATRFMPFECGHERHLYEHCQYVEYVRHSFRLVAASTACCEVTLGALLKRTIVLRAALLCVTSHAHRTLAPVELIDAVLCRWLRAVEKKLGALE